MSLIRTDLAVESAAPYREHLPEGITVEEQESGGVKLTRVTITSESAAKKVGRECGSYVTAEIPDSMQSADELTRLLSTELCALLPESGGVLVVGLGNLQITPDALGPRTVRKIFATRHIPADVAEETGLTGLRPVSAIAPGVMGQTGIETGEIIHSLVRDTAPAAVIVIDALASQSVERLGRTIQLSSVGISPGSGVLNSRRALSEATLGVPVISMGIPTVVDGGTLACELLGCDDEEKIPEAARTMMVTPRDIDKLIDRGSEHLSLAINTALHPRLTPEDIVYLVS